MGQASHSALEIWQSDATREQKIRAFEAEVVEQQNPFAAYWLGVLHEKDGRLKEAGVWYGTSVAIAELPEAQFKLGVLAASRDPSLAVEWYRLAAAREYPPAFLQLGVAYWSGSGVERDVRKSYDFFVQAAERGVAAAQYLVGVYFDEGRLGPPDPARAHQWFAIAAHRGVLDAQFKLAVQLANGVGCVRDLAWAHAWVVVCAGGLRGASTPDPEKSAALESLMEQLQADGPTDLDSQSQPIWRALIANGCMAESSS